MKKIPTFDQFNMMVPEEVRVVMDKCEKTPQGKQWHPEGDVKIHSRIVFNRAKRTGDWDLVIAAYFHDLGKAFTTTKHPTIPDKWSAKMHEIFSTKIVDTNKDWIEKVLGGNFQKIRFIVSQHMRAHLFNEMRRSKQLELMKSPWFEDLILFSSFDDMLTDFSNDING